jgi:hypothetical protein
VWRAENWVYLMAAQTAASKVRMRVVLKVAYWAGQ